MPQSLALRSSSVGSELNEAGAAQGHFALRPTFSSARLVALPRSTITAHRLKPTDVCPAVACVQLLEIIPPTGLRGDHYATFAL